ncbi:MAG: hypothetical protein ACHQW9_03895 [Nitrososphaerales archaeon]
MQVTSLSVCFLQTLANTHNTKLTKCNLKNLSKNQEFSKNSLTEFDGIAQMSDVDSITIDKLDCAASPSNNPVTGGQKMKDLLEQKTILAIEPYVLAVLEENKVDPGLQHQNLEQISSVLQKIASQMSAQTTCYFRAGRAYLRISHEMGDIGNIFFKSLFYNVLKDFGENYHLQTQENTICAICKI